MPVPAALPLRITAISVVPPPLWVIWLATSEGPVPYFPRVAEAIVPHGVWIQAAFTEIPRI